MFNREPALIMAAVQAVIAVAVGFGLEWSGEQVSLVTVAAAAILGLVVRQKVTPVDSAPPFGD